MIWVLIAEKLGDTLITMSKLEAFEIRKTLEEMKKKLEFLRGSL
jgi:hypothetical protein